MCFDEKDDLQDLTFMMKVGCSVDDFFNQTKCSQEKRCVQLLL